MLSETNIDVRAKTILGQFHMKIAKGMEAFRTKSLGLRQNKSGMRDVVREVNSLKNGIK